MHPDTRVVRFDPAPGDPHRPTNTPIYQTATFSSADADELATLTRPDVLERLADLGIVPTRYRDLSD